MHHGAGGEVADGEIIQGQGKGQHRARDDALADFGDNYMGEGLSLIHILLKRVPVYNAVLKEVDHRLLPILDGRIEGAAPDKVFYLVAPDDSMRGFRILRDDLCLIVPSGSPIDGAVMLVEHNQHRYLRKVKKLDALNVLLQSYDREYAAETCALPDVNFLGRVVKVEFSL